MKKMIAVLLAAVPFVSSQYTYEELEVNLLSNELAAKNFTYQHLRLYPINAKVSFQKKFRDIGKYVPLKQAVQNKKVRISEKGNGGSVNELTIENLSSDTVMVITGDVIQGGKQDRIIGKDMILSPKSGKKQLSVFCVESGRWEYRNRKPEEFRSHFNSGSVGLRKIVEKDAKQDKVWSKVQEINTKNKTNNATSTYTAIQSSKAFNERLHGYVKHFKNVFQKDQNVIGVVAVSGNKVIACDMFATPWLFQQHFENLLASYATEAIIEGSPVKINTAVVQTYLDQLLKNETVQAATLKEKGKTFQEKGKKLRVSAY